MRHNKVYKSLRTFLAAVALVIWIGTSNLSGLTLVYHALSGSGPGHHADNHYHSENHYGHEQEHSHSEGGHSEQRTHGQVEQSLILAARVSTIAQLDFCITSFILPGIAFTPVKDQALRLIDSTALAPPQQNIFRSGIGSRAPPLSC